MRKNSRGGAGALARAVSGLAVVAVLVTATACDESSNAAQQQAAAPPPAVSVAKPVVREVVEDDEFGGRFEAVDEVDIRARVGGYLQKIHFTDGALVKEGELLFTIDQRPFRTAVDEAEANLTIAESQVEFTTKQLERARELSKRGNISVSALDERENEFLAAQAQVQGAKATLENARLDLEYTEDSGCDTDMNVVMTGKGGFVEVQGTAEGDAFNRAELDAMIALASDGIGQLVQIQKSVLGL